MKSNPIILKWGCVCSVLVFMLSGCASLNSAFITEQLAPVTTVRPVAAAGTEDVKSTIEDELEEGPLSLTVTEAVVRSLEHNPSLTVRSYTPEMRRTAEEERLAVFDPVVGGTLEAESERSPRGDGAENFESSNQASLDTSLEKTFAAGTRVSVEIDSEIAGDSGPESTRLGLTVTQPVLRGYGVEVNLAPYEEARLDTRISEYELRGFTESLVARVEGAYWDFVLAERQVEIFEQSLELARRNLEEIRERISIGDLARVEEVAAETEVARRREGLINARSDLETARLNLMRLLGTPGGGGWERKLRLLDTPAVPDRDLLPVDENLSSAYGMRTDLNQARLQILRGDLEVVRTRNGLLPRLDFFLTLGKTGYRDAFLESIGDLPGGEGYDIQFGLTTRFPLFNREALAANRRAMLGLEQSRVALENLQQLIQLDVRSAWIEAGRLREQITATAATRSLQEKNLEAETEKFRVGRSTSFLVAQAQRDLVQSRIEEIGAVVNYLKALVELYRLDGSLLARRGIKAPGDIPVEFPSR